MIVKLPINKYFGTKVIISDDIITFTNRKMNYKDANDFCHMIEKELESQKFNIIEYKKHITSKTKPRELKTLKKWEKEYSEDMELLLSLKSMLKDIHNG